MLRFKVPLRAQREVRANRSQGAEQARSFHKPFLLSSFGFLPTFLPTSRMEAAPTTPSPQTSASGFVNLGIDGKELPRPRLHHSSTDKEQQFPHKLYEMLESVDSLGLSYTVSWLPNGRGFQVKDPTKFMNLVVPHFFMATKYRSFQRQLVLSQAIPVIQFWFSANVKNGSCTYYALTANLCLRLRQPRY